MEDNEREVYKAAITENVITLFAAVLLVSFLMTVTESFHSLWGLLLLVNLNVIRMR